MMVIQVLVLLLLCAVALGWSARRLNIPYPIALVLGGACLGFVPTLPELPMDPNLILVIVLPPILYQAAILTSWRDFRRALRDIFLLAVGMVITTTVAVAATAHFLIPTLPWAAAFALGAIVSAPDAVAATAILSRLRIPKRIVTVLEGESLINDATGLVVYKFAVAAVLTGAFSLAQASVQFVFIALGGIVIGLALGWLFVALHRRLSDALIEVTASLVLPYCAYLAAEALHVSGVLAVVAAGLVRGWHAPEVFSAQSRILVYAVWDIVVFLLNSLVFIFIGLQLSAIVERLSDYGLSTLLGYAAAISAVAIVVRLLGVFPSAYLPWLVSRRIRASERMPSWQEVSIVGWGGMRGIVSLAAALALPLVTETGAAFPGRDLIIFLTFAVIVSTLVLQGLTLSPLIRWLGIGEDCATSREERLARLRTAQAAIEEIERLSGAQMIPFRIIMRLRAEYEARLREAGLSTLTSIMRVSADYEARLREAGLSTLTVGANEEPARQIRLAAIAAERRALIQLRREKLISDEVLHRIERELDLEETWLAAVM